MASERIAFAITSPLLLDHYLMVWKALPPELIAVVFSDDGQPDSLTTDQIRSYLEERGLSEITRNSIEVRHVQDVLSSGESYPVVVSNTRLGDLEDQYERDGLRSRQPGAGSPSTIEALGRVTVKFPYGADGNRRWTFGPWNVVFDHFLCHGRHDATEYSELFPSSTTTVIGYPKYERYWSTPEGIARKELGPPYDIDGPLVWLPTASDFNSVDLWLDAMREVSLTIPVVVRPHWLSLRHQPSQVERLQASGIPMDTNWSADLTLIYRVARAIACDFGGTVFSSVYLDKPTLCLEVPKMEEEWWAEHSTVATAREGLGVVAARGGAEGILGALQSLETSDSQSKQRSLLRQTFFGETISNPVSRAASRLLQIHARELTA